jgi:carbamate kinase
MRIVIALGGNALPQRTDPLTAEVDRKNVRLAAKAIAPLAADHDIVVMHGNGPQVGLQQELRSLLPTRQVVTLLTTVVVNADDPAEPQQILEIQPITWLLDWGAVVICAGGGMPARYASSPPGTLVGVEAVADKDLASELLAEDVHADLFLMCTDVDGAYLHWGSPAQRRLGWVTPEELASYDFAAGSMGRKTEAAGRFAAKTGRRAAIGALADIPAIVTGQAGTNVVRDRAADS